MPSPAVPSGLSAVCFLSVTTPARNKGQGSVQARCPFSQEKIGLPESPVVDICFSRRCDLTPRLCGKDLGFSSLHRGDRQESHISTGHARFPKPRPFARFSSGSGSHDPLWKLELWSGWPGVGRAWYFPCHRSHHIRAMFWATVILSLSLSWTGVIVR